MVLLDPPDRLASRVSKDPLVSLERPVQQPEVRDAMAQTELLEQMGTPALLEKYVVSLALQVYRDSLVKMEQPVRRAILALPELQEIVASMVLRGLPERWVCC